MTEDELKGALSAVRDRMLNEQDGGLSDIRKQNLDRYMGEPDGRERPGYSSYVTREVFEAIEWALPSLLRTFTAGDRLVSFEPVGPEDEEQAGQETDIVNHYLMKENNGFMVFYEWFKDALINPNGYAKVWTETVTTVKTERYQGLTEYQLQAISEDPNNEITEATERQTAIMTPQGMMPVMVYDVKVRVTEKVPKLRIEAVPPEQVGVDPETTSVSLDESRFLVHRSIRTKSWLLEAGYDSDLLDTVPSYAEDSDWNSEVTNRNKDTNSLRGGDETLDESTELYELEEWYVQIDYDDDGIAERRKIDVIGGEVFDNEEYDYQPLVALSCIPIPHRHDGLSMATVVGGIQDLSTYYQRAINDNIARVNRPRKYINESAVTSDGMTIEQLMDIDNDIVVTRDVNGIMPEQHQPVIQELLAVHQSVKDQVQLRTGSNPGIALDPDILQKATQGAYAQGMNAAAQLSEMVARIFAETGVKDMMIKAHRQIKEYQDQAKVMKIRGKWVETNPQDWRDRTNVTVNVGLGFSDKAQQVATAGQLIELQMKLASAGMATPQNIMNSLEDFVEAIGRKGADRYFTLPQPQQGQQQPDPLVMAQIQALNQEQQRLSQQMMGENQRKNAEMDAKLEKMNADTQKAIADAMKAFAEAGAAQNTAMAGQMGVQFGQD